MLWSKSCPRCRGGLYENPGIYGRYIDCFQCSHYSTTVEEAHVRSDGAYGRSYTQPPARPVRVLSGMAA